MRNVTDRDNAIRLNCIAQRLQRIVDPFTSLYILVGSVQVKIYCRKLHALPSSNDRESIKTVAPFEQDRFRWAVQNSICRFSRMLASLRCVPCSDSRQHVFWVNLNEGFLVTLHPAIHKLPRSSITGSDRVTITAFIKEKRLWHTPQGILNKEQEPLPSIVPCNGY